MSSASEAELGAMFIKAQEMVATRQTLQEMKWPQPKSPLQTDNSTAAGVVNNTIIPRKLKTMDRRLHCLRCRESQGQFRYYWASGKLNWGDYSTKHHPPPSIMNPEECNFQEIQLVSKASSPSKVPARVYLSWCQVELTFTCNPHTPCIHGNINTETCPRLDSSCQFGGHRLTT